MIKKASSAGPEMVRRREWTKEWMDESRVTEIVLGGDALETARQLREPPTVQLPGMEWSSRRLFLEDRMSQELMEVRKHLVDVSNRIPEEVERMFRMYLKRQTDIDAAARRLHFDYDHDDDFTSFLDDCMDDEKHKPVTERRTREEVRRPEMEREMANVLTRRFTDGVSELYKILDDDVLLEVLQDRRVWLGEQKERLREGLERALPVVYERFRTATKEGALPIDPRVVEERLALLSVDVLDPLAHRLKDVDGEFNIRHH